MSPFHAAPAERAPEARRQDPPRVVLEGVRADGPAGGEALHGVDLRLWGGEMVVVFGPPQSGKSTLLQCMAGLVRPTEGAVTVLGQVPHDPRSRVRGRIGWVGSPLRSGLEETLDAPRLLRSWARFWGDGAEAREARVREAAALALLDDVPAGRPVSTLDLDHQARVRLALALLGRPGVLLLDEWTARVARHRREEVYNLLHAWSRERGMTIVLGSRDLTEAQYVADTVVLMEQGVVLASGPWSSLEVKAEALQRRGLGGGMA